MLITVSNIIPFPISKSLTPVVELHEMHSLGFIRSESLEKLMQMRKSNYQHYLILLLELHTGLSLQELKYLKYEQIDLIRGELHMPNKDRLKERAILLSKNVTLELARNVRKSDPKGLVFPTYGAKGLRTERSLQKIMTNFSRTTGQEYSVRYIREIIAGYLTQKGFRFTEIQEYLGHRASRSTKKLIQPYLAATSVAFPQ